LPQSHTTFQHGNTPTVVLVHGAFADASSWSAVIADLHATGFDVIAPAVALQSLAEDADYVASVADQFNGPVLLVGHSYGGAVITVAGAHARNTVGLVYIAALAPEAGESSIDATRGFPDTLLPQSLRPARFRNRNREAATELYLKLDAFHATLAADTPERDATIAAICQRPVAATALDEKAQAAAWKTLPSWYLVTTADRAIHPDAQRFMAHRAHARTVEVDASHAVARSQPAAVAELIRAAATRSSDTRDQA
jgi:pimeloyl-ACP methyl ester carboxylesterase